MASIMEDFASFEMRILIFFFFSFAKLWEKYFDIYLMDELLKKISVTLVLVFFLEPYTDIVYRN